MQWIHLPITGSSKQPGMYCAGAMATSLPCRRPSLYFASPLCVRKQFISMSLFAVVFFLKNGKGPAHFWAFLVGKSIAVVAVPFGQPLHLFLLFGKCISAYMSCHICTVCHFTGCIFTWHITISIVYHLGLYSGTSLLLPFLTTCHVLAGTSSLVLLSAISSTSPLSVIPWSPVSSTSSLSPLLATHSLSISHTCITNSLLSREVAVIRTIVWIIIRLFVHCLNNYTDDQSELYNCLNLQVVE